MYRRKRLDRFCRAEGVPAAPRAALAQVAVGAAECASCEPSSGGGDGYDRVQVDITWSASEGGGEPENRTHRLTLARAEGVQSVRGLSSLDCPSCGGALAESDAVKCQYCGEPLTGGRAEWCLEGIEG